MSDPTSFALDLTDDVLNIFCPVSEPMSVRWRLTNQALWPMSTALRLTRSRSVPTSHRMNPPSSVLELTDDVLNLSRSMSVPTSNALNLILRALMLTSCALLPTLYRFALTSGELVLTTHAQYSTNSSKVSAHDSLGLTQNMFA